MFQIVPVIFQGANQPGDFNWMIRQPEYNDVLFLFNDNQEQFLAFLNGKPEGRQEGGGNAIIRPYQAASGYQKPQAAGIPTGVNRQGYTDFDQARPYIDIAFEKIKKLLNTGNYKRVIYSAAKDGRSLGTSIYSPSENIKRYIVSRIEHLKI